MPTRVSSTQMADRSLYSISTAYARLDTAQRHVNTGRRIEKPSDDPSGTAQVLGLRARLGEIEQFGRSMDQAKGFMSTTETALDGVSALIRQARSYALSGANDTLDGDTRAALATQIGNIIGQITQIGNSNYGARHVFAGQRTDAPAFVGSAYQGGTDDAGDGAIFMDIGRGESIRVNVTGEAVLTPVIEKLEALRLHVAYGESDKVSREDLAALDTEISSVMSARADLGSKIQRVENTRQRNDALKVNFTAFMTDIEDVDMPTAIVELQTAQTAYQAAVQSTAFAYQTSLLDFLR